MRKLFIFCFILLTIGLRAQYPAFMPEFKVMNTKIEIREHNAVNGSVVLLRGIDSINDGNGALFQFDNTSVDPDNDSTIFAVTGVVTGRWLKMNVYGGSIFNIEGDTMIVINNIKIKNILKIPLTDTVNAKKGCANIIYDTILEHFFGDVCLNGVHQAWRCFDCAFNTTHQISDTCFLLQRLDGTQDTVCITGGVGGATSWTNLFSAAFAAAGGVPGSSTDYGQISGRQTGWVAETGVQFVMSEDFIMQRLFVRTSTSQPAGGSLVITFRVEGSNTALTISIPAGSAAGTFSDVTHTVSVSAGQIIDWQVTNGSGSTSATIISIGATAVSN